MGFLDRLFGLGDDDRRVPPPPTAHVPASGSRDGVGRYAPPPPPAASGTASGPSSDDARALERYRYLLRTAPPETVEQVHAEAFARLTPSQRQQGLAGGGQRHRAPDPVEQRRAKRCLESVNLLTQCWLTHAQKVGRLGEMPGFRHR